jgi:hypothetical protein
VLLHPTIEVNFENSDEVSAVRSLFHTPIVLPSPVCIFLAAQIALEHT